MAILMTRFRVPVEQQHEASALSDRLSMNKCDTDLRGSGGLSRNEYLLQDKRLHDRFPGFENAICVFCFIQ